MLYAMAKTYGCRPSAFYSGMTDLEALTVDIAAMEYGSRAEQRANEAALQRVKARRRG